MSAPNRFKVGKYDVIAQPAAGSAHMLRYTVLLQGRRLGAQLSMPCESDCRFMEAPPAVPPLRIYSVTYRPGRPRKGTVRPQSPDGDEHVSLPWAIRGQRRY